MPHHSAFKLLGCLAICGLFATTGCRNLQTQGRADEEWDPEFVQVMKPSFFHLPHNKQIAFASLHEGWLIDIYAASEGNVDVYYSSIFNILAAPVVEQPEFWSRIINDPDREQLVRWHCLQALLLRHLELGDPLAKLRRIAGSDNWFTEARFRSTGALNAIGVERRPDEFAIVFTPDLQPAEALKKAGRWIFFSVGSLNKGEEITLEEILDELHGKRPRKRLVITQIWIG